MPGQDAARDGLGRNKSVPLVLKPGAEPYPGYCLDRKLGKGGWGEVWKATREDGEELALKFLPVEANFLAAKELRGLQGIRQLTHPNLLPIYQVWCCSGYVVVAMELADGSLLDLFETYWAECQEPIFPEHVCFYLSQVAEALDYLNRRQHTIAGQRVAFRHCDIKPSNLLLMGRTVKLADFSLVVQTTSPLCPHRRVGTPAFAGPELLDGWLSEHSDQFGLAATYCYLRTGQLPFGKEGTRTTPDLSMLPREERKIISKGLSHVPQDRWPSCRVLMQHLSACQENSLALTP